MKSFTDALCWFVGVLAFLFACWEMIVFVTFKDARGFSDTAGGVNHLWMAVGAAALACACLVANFLRHPRIEEEIHVTK